MTPTTAGCVRALAGMTSVVILESIAMITGHNGTMLRLSIAIVAGLGGFAVGSLLRKQPNKEN